MGEHMSREMNEAKKVVAEIVKHQRTSSDRMSQFEKQVEDLKTAQRKMTEAVAQKNVVRPVGDDTILSKYRDADGGLVLKTKSVKVEVDGRGSLTGQQEGLLDAAIPANDWHQELLEQVRERTLARMVMTDPYTPKADLKLYKHLMKAPQTILPSINKAFNDQAGTGSEFIPDEFVSSLYQSFEQRGNIRALLQTVEVDRATILIPRMDRGSRPYIKSQIVSNDPALYQASDIATAQKTINIVGLASRIIVDDAAAEDAAFAMTSLLSSTLSQDIEDAFEDACINGHTAGTQDDLANWNIRQRWGSTGLGTSGDHRRLFDGMRRLALSTKNSKVDVGGTAATFNNIISGLGQMGEYGVADKVIIVSPEVMVSSIMNMTETKTLDVFGPQASVLQGQIASVLGMPIIMSRFMSSDLNATGVYDNVTKTRSGMLIFARDSYYQYLRRGITVESQKDVRNGGIEIVATLRSTMTSPDADAKKNLCFLYNIAY
jgi:HK97 family phage major capsid protein